MKAPEIPREEPARLDTLRSLNIMDTRSEERFDRITRMAKQLFGAPIALFSLVEENRQWFKSCIGVDATEKPRDTSFCGHAILGDEVFVIPDAREDERFADNPQVRGEPHIRFYAGCPVRAPNGHKLGTLCVIDQRPRHLEQEEAAALKDLAAMVESELAALQLVTLDDLTNLSNRRGFLVLGQHSLRICIRQGVSAALVFMDLDNFKTINDTHGHAEGDRALKTFGSLLERECRDSDVVARLGGDEFALLMRDATTKHARLTKDRLRRTLEIHNRQADSGYDLDFSYGVVESTPRKRQNVEELLQNADWVMYEMKRARHAL